MPHKQKKKQTIHLYGENDIQGDRILLQLFGARLLQFIVSILQENLISI